MSDQIVARLIELMIAGEPVDWAAAETRYPAEAAVIRELQSIGKLAAGRHVINSTSPAAAASPGLWARRAHMAIAAVAAFEILAALIGFRLGYIRSRGGVPPGAYAVALAGFGLPAAWLIFGGRRDPRAFTLATLLLLIATAFASRFLQPPMPIAPMFNGLYPDAWVPAVLWAFVRQFPRTLHYSRGDRLAGAAERCAAVVGGLLFAANVIDAHIALPHIFRLLLRDDPGGIVIYWTLFFALLAPAPVAVLMRSRDASRDERRRLTVFSVGFAAVLLVTAGEIAVELAFPPFGRYMTAHRTAATPLFFGVLLLLPVTTAYAVLVDSVLDVRITIGKVARYLLARNVALALTVLPFTGIAIYLYGHRDQTIASLSAGWAGLTMISAFVIGLALTVLREPMVRLVDTYFDRHTVDLHAQTAAIASLISNARSMSELADILERELPVVLGLTHLTVFERLHGDQGFRATTAGTPTLGAQSAIALLATADRSPVAVSPEVQRLLPAGDRRWCADHDVATLVPMMATGDAIVGFLVLGQKTSAETLTRAELAFLSATAASAAVRWESLSQPADHSDRRASGDEPAFECADCGAVFQSRVTCACGGRSRPASVPFVLASKFQAVRYVGAGGMGVVYRATDLTLTRPVALKTLERLSGAAADRLVAEARMMAAVDHPNLATIFAVERWRQTPVLVLEFCELGTLAARIRSPQSIEDTLRLGVAVAPALEQLHAAGILHRDIKPSNIGFGRDDTPKLLDFGLASFVSTASLATTESAASAPSSASVTQTVPVSGDRALAGTPLYLPPEALAGAAPYPGFDLWALALVLFEAMAGDHPFAGRTVHDVMNRIRRCRELDLARFRSDCPQRVASAFRELLSPDPSARPATAGEFRMALTRLLA